ncbi:TIGR03086 family metal-binding protein [Streptomyces sp. NRRL F-5126]|uniref:TIGR03086 family metal-binding protein n=1 Tax=Streptomyces sp. NRRL F-5126 TaxID=1463857 RepID=UPI00056C2C44|nr:TIGR03086 family metal-binding protein [Streptomyces sp. NRRL F-5126]
MDEKAETAKTDMIDLGPACAGMRAVAGGVREEQLGGATPCTEYAVRELLAHVVGLSEGLAASARKERGPATDSAPGSTGLPVLQDGWRAALERHLGDLADAWRSPGAWDGWTRAGSVDLPARMAGFVTLNELLVHAWDLARATGQPYDPDEASVRASYAAMAAATSSGDGDRGPFGPPVAVPDGAPTLDRLIGWSGRDPGWLPGR